jgi:hypothetical protein
MTDILTDLSPSPLAVAIKANLYAFFQSFRSSSQATVDNNSHEFRWHTSIAHPWYNGVLSNRPPAEDLVNIRIAERSPKPLWLPRKRQVHSRSVRVNHLLHKRIERAQRLG